jgi:hypothetical protein
LSLLGIKGEVGVTQKLGAEYLNEYCGIFDWMHGMLQRAA